MRPLTPTGAGGGAGCGIGDKRDAPERRRRDPGSSSRGYLPAPVRAGSFCPLAVVSDRSYRPRPAPVSTDHSDAGGPARRAFAEKTASAPSACSPRTGTIVIVSHERSRRKGLQMRPGR